MFTVSFEQLSENANISKEEFINAMESEKVITAEQASEMRKYSIVISKKGFLGKFWDQMWQTSSDSVHAIVVKVIEQPNYKK